ncbi:MAG: hypothetical protein OEV31_09300 [Gammaproteobacteria bacterium]|nr:hypothetical protein [Gammaproteobacteria bacterium]
MTDAPRKNKILFVPGKNPKPRPEEHRALLWRCLLRGIDLVSPAVAHELAAASECFLLAQWNSIYYGHVKAVDEDVPWIDKLCYKSGPDAADVREALSWRNRRARLLYTLADLFPFIIPLTPDPAVKSTVRETERYFRNEEGIATRVREIVKAPLRQMMQAGERILLIGHSLGAVIAYDALWELTHLENNPRKVDLFLTLGSPLGMRFVQDRLLGFHNRDGRRFPENLRHWINVAAHGDVTALDPEVRDDFLPMLEQGLITSIEDRHQGVFNWFRNEEGLNAHRSYGYLVEPHTARAIVNWWQGNGDRRSATERRGAESLAARGGIT